MRRLLPRLLISSLIFGAFLVINPTSTYAVANFYLSPSRSTVTQGSVFSVTVRVSSAEAIDSVQANLSYPADKLDFISINSGGSAFSLEWPSSGGGGSVKIARSTVGAISGDKLVASISFRAKASLGTASIGFTGGTEATNAGNPVAGGTSGGVYTFAPPPAPPPPPDTTPPKISNVNVTAISVKGATIEWKTDEASSSVVEYGLSVKYGLSANGAGQTKDHKVSFTSDLILPGLVYHFRVKSADAAGNLTTSSDSTFRTSGYTVKIKVVDQKGKPIKGAKVTLGSGDQTATTDKRGVATFANVEPGKQLVTVEFKGKVQGTPIEVKDATEEEVASGKIKTQSFEVEIAAASINYELVEYGFPIVIAILLGALLGILALFWWERRGRGQPQKEKPDKPAVKTFNAEDAKKTVPSKNTEVSK
jgi:hypothetical protein